MSIFQTEYLENSGNTKTGSIVSSIGNRYVWFSTNRMCQVYKFREWCCLKDSFLLLYYLWYHINLFFVAGEFDISQLNKADISLKTLS
jgi:hypothetical protein